MYYALKKKKNKKLRTPIVNIEPTKIYFRLLKTLTTKLSGVHCEYAYCVHIARTKLPTRSQKVRHLYLFLQMNFSPQMDGASRRSDLELIGNFASRTDYAHPRTIPT